MMPQQRRWICRECSREWVFSNTANDNCPGCGSPEVEQITFNGLFDSKTPPDVFRGKDEVNRDAFVGFVEVTPPPTALRADGDWLPDWLEW
jgi:hypothetical protein